MHTRGGPGVIVAATRPEANVAGGRCSSSVQVGRNPAAARVAMAGSVGMALRSPTRTSASAGPTSAVSSSSQARMALA